MSDLSSLNDALCGYCIGNLRVMLKDSDFYASKSSFFKGFNVYCGNGDNRCFGIVGFFNVVVCNFEVAGVFKRDSSLIAINFYGFDSDSDGHGLICREFIDISDPEFDPNDILWFVLFVINCGNFDE